MTNKKNLLAPVFHGLNDGDISESAKRLQALRNSYRKRGNALKADPYMNGLNRDANVFIANHVKNDPTFLMKLRFKRLINKAIKACPAHLRPDLCDVDMVTNQLKLSKENTMKESTDLRKFYKLDKTILPRNIAIDHGVTVSVIRALDNENNLVAIEGDEMDLQDFISLMDLEEVQDQGVDVVDNVNEEMMGIFSVDPFGLNESKSPAAQMALQAMDSDEDWYHAVENALKKFPDVSKEDLEAELEKYV